MVKEVPGQDDQLFDNLAVGGFGRWSIVLRALLSSFFRETLENFAAIQKRRGRLRRSAKLFALHLQSIRGITN